MDVRRATSPRRSRRRSWWRPRTTARLGGDPSERLRGLRRIGIDELSYRKHHRYVTVVVDLDTRRVVWVAEGKDAAALDVLVR